MTIDYGFTMTKANSGYQLEIRTYSNDKEIYKDRVSFLFSNLQRKKLRDTLKKIHAEERDAL